MPGMLDAAGPARADDARHRPTCCTPRIRGRVRAAASWDLRFCAVTLWALALAARAVPNAVTWPMALASGVTFAGWRFVVRMLPVWAMVRPTVQHPGFPGWQAR